MPTLRRKIPRPMHQTEVPAWARKLLETGELPELNSEAIAWLYLGADVCGLPDAASPQGELLWGPALARRRQAG